MDNELINNYQKIISKSIWSYIRETNNTNLDVEDLTQELWMKLLEYNKKYGKMPDYALAKQICHNALVDITRKGMHRNHLSMELDSEGDRASWEQDYNQDVVPDSELNSLVDMFPEGSKERLYIDFYLAKSGVKDTGVVPEMSRTEDGYTDNNLAKMLGFSGSSDKKWRKFRDKMKEIITDYYGQKYVGSFTNTSN